MLSLGCCFGFASTSQPMCACVRVQVAAWVLQHRYWLPRRAWACQVMYCHSVRAVLFPEQHLSLICWHKRRLLVPVCLRQQGLGLMWPAPGGSSQHLWQYRHYGIRLQTCKCQIPQLVPCALVHIRDRACSRHLAAVAGCFCCRYCQSWLMCALQQPVL